MKINFRTSTEKMTVIAICTALTIVLSQIAIPMPSSVPVTLQTFAIALCGYLLGAKYAPVSIFLYVALGAIGLPVFANFSGGISVIFGYTGGFIWGFIAMAAFCGVGTLFKNKIISVAFGVLGLLVCHFCGAIQYALIADIGIFSSIMLVSLPYLLKDVISVVCAYSIVKLIIAALRKSKIIPA